MIVCAVFVQAMILVLSKTNNVDTIPRAFTSTDKQTDRQTDKQTDRQTNRQTDRYKHTERERRAEDEEAGRLTDWLTTKRTHMYQPEIWPLWFRSLMNRTQFKFTLRVSVSIHTDKTVTPPYKHIHTGQLTEYSSNYSLLVLLTMMGSPLKVDLVVERGDSYRCN